MARGYKWQMPRTVIDSFKNIKANLKDGYQFGDISAGWYGFAKNRDDESLKVTQKDLEAPSDIMGELEPMFEDQKQQLKEDREWDLNVDNTKYQRAVEDMKAAGLNPYTIGASGVSGSPSSSVGKETIQTKLQYLGYVLDLKNLDLQNKKVANGILGNIIRAIGYAV